MQTEELIQSLASDLSPVSRRAVELRIAFGIFMGGLFSVAIVVFAPGLRPDILQAMSGSAFWIKWSYTILLAAGGIAMTIQLARPDALPLTSFRLVLLPCGLQAIAVILELAFNPRRTWLGSWLGHSWKPCSLLIFMLSVPIFIGLCWALRRLAPTRLRAVGAAAGLAAGGCAATVYALHCPEVAASFVMTWYTLGIGLAALVGGLVGPRVLRW